MFTSLDGLGELTTASVLLRDGIVTLFASGDAVPADMARRRAAEPVFERVPAQEEAEGIIYAPQKRR